MDYVLRTNDKDDDDDDGLSGMVVMVGSGLTGEHGLNINPQGARGSVESTLQDDVADV